MKYTDSSKYLGGFLNDKINGVGIFILPNGNKIKGNFRNGFFGEGIYKMDKITDFYYFLKFWNYKLLKYFSTK